MNAGLFAVVCSAVVCSAEPFVIEIVDSRTGRGVPMVELETVNNIRLTTDSNGLAAFDEPGLTGIPTYFHVRSHGYEFPKDGFGFRGRSATPTAGGSITWKIDRVNIAERLYRVTGAGIYADTVRAGRRPPTKLPLLNAGVLGSDSVVNAIYKGKLRWFWGDTNRPGYPLGMYQTPGAVSDLPGAGGLDPEVGVDLTYFGDGKAFVKFMAPMAGPGPTWINGLVVIREGERERMFAHYVKVKNLLDIYEHGLCEYDDATDVFKPAAKWPMGEVMYPGGHPIRLTEGGIDYVVFVEPYPMVRVRADAASLADLSKYEAFTCLERGSRAKEAKVERGADGRAVWAWKRDTSPVTTKDQADLLRAGKLKADEAIWALRDVETGKTVRAHAGSVYWNEFRKRWVMIMCEHFGTSLLGEIWFAEADAPTGPWVYARKVLTHDKYSFYNPKQHPYFDKAGGRVIFFEGTYTHTFSGNPHQTPRYEYNQMMYKLDLADERLVLPAAIRRGADGRLAPGATGEVAFFAPDRSKAGLVPVRPGADGRLSVGDGPGEPVFHALPADAPADGPTVALFEFRSADGKVRYSTRDAEPGFTRVDKPLVRVWANPVSVALP